MAAVVGRIRECPLLDVKLTLLSHNLVRGAAGAALLNAELLAARGLLRRMNAREESTAEPVSR
jgi:aspartate-semialdehyde dehydrogenase